MLLPNPIAFEVFGRPIYWYGILIAAAVLAAILLCMKRAKMYDMDSDTIVDLALFIIPSALIGARLYYVIFSWGDFASDPLRILYVWEGGLAFYGGVIGAAVAGIVCCRVRKIDLIRLTDLVAPALALGQAIGRWGNFVNQEAYGTIVRNPSLQFFPYAVFIESQNAWHMATFFYESAVCLLIAVFLLWFAKRASAPRKGSSTLLYLLLYGVERAIVEGFRTDSLYIGSLRVSQVLSILLVALSAALLIYRTLKGRQAVVEVDPNLVMRMRNRDGDALAEAGEADAGEIESGETDAVEPPSDEPQKEGEDA